MSGNGTPIISNSARVHPEPIPRSARPSLRWSSVVVACAVVAGWRKRLQRTSAPTRTRLVAAAIAPRIVVASHAGVVGSSALPSRCS